MLKKILLAVAVLVVGVCAVVASRPAEFKIERSAVINASPEVAFAQVNDFHKWEGWSPWAKLDPSQQNTFTGTITPSMLDDVLRRARELTDPASLPPT